MNDQLRQLYDADRAEHGRVPEVGIPAYQALRERDRRRRERAGELLGLIAEPTAEDLYHAAWLYNHGDTAEEALVAHRLAKTAASLGHAQAGWLSAASYDRHRMYRGLPQRYGTQIVPDGVRYRVWDTDPGTTDAERAALGVPPLAEQHRRAALSSLRTPQPPMEGAPDWLKRAIARWKREAGSETSDALPDEVTPESSGGTL